MCCLKDVVSIIQGIVMIIGIIVGGFWTYLLFIRQRISYPRLNIKFDLQNASLPENKRLVHVEVHLNNIGNVLISPNYAELRLRYIVPIPDKLIPILKRGADPIPKGSSEYEWPLFFKREWNFESDDFEIEPLEQDSMHADFFIPNTIQVIQLYLFIRNPIKNRADFGWTQTHIFNLNIKEIQ